MSYVFADEDGFPVATVSSDMTIAEAAAIVHPFVEFEIIELQEDHWQICGCETRRFYDGTPVQDVEVFYNVFQVKGY
jgi:hypothetical protein